MSKILEVKKQKKKKTIINNIQKLVFSKNGLT